MSSQTSNRNASKVTPDGAYGSGNNTVSNSFANATHIQTEQINKS